MNTLTSIIFEKRLIRRQISQIQHECVLLLDGFDKLPELTKEMQLLQKSLISCISEILEQIRNVYPNYMDEDIRMPQMQVITEAAQVQASIEMLAELFLSPEVDPQLQKAVLHCMKDAARLKRITYGRMRYVQRLQTLLIELLSND